MDADGRRYSVSSKVLLVRGTRITIARETPRYRTVNGSVVAKIAFVRARVVDVETRSPSGMQLVYPMVCWKTARRETNASKRRAASGYRSRIGRVATNTEGFVWARGWGSPVERAILVARALSACAKTP